jgi:hypothetical protein
MSNSSYWYVRKGRKSVVEMLCSSRLSTVLLLVVGVVSVSSLQHIPPEECAGEWILILDTLILFQLLAREDTYIYVDLLNLYIDLTIYTSLKLPFPYTRISTPDLNPFKP